MNEPELVLPFSPSEVDRVHYAASLLQLGAPLLTPDQQGAIKAGLDDAFVETAAQFTKRASSTLPRRQAERLYESVVYQLDAALRSYPGDTAALRALQTVPVSRLLQQGQRLILAECETVRQLFEAARALRQTPAIPEYDFVMEDAYSQFAAGYSARFDATNCIADINYPLMGRPAYALPEEGVHYMRAYYTALLRENEFCALFDAGERLWLLRQYGALFHTPFPELLFNIAEVVYRNFLVCALCGKPEFSLRLSERDLEHVYAAFSGATLEAFALAVHATLLPYAKRIRNPALMLYLRAYRGICVPELYARLAPRTLCRYLCVSPD